MRMVRASITSKAGGGSDPHRLAGSVAEKPSFPASAPDVISVGGTTLHLTAEGTRESEPVWNGDGPANENKGSGHVVSGGGCSTVFTAQPWQQNVLGWSGTGCGSKRLDDDVAADSGFGLSIYDNYNCGKACEEEHFGISPYEWRVVGGTSLSSPIVAAMFGLAGGAGGVSYPAATLYSHFGESSAFFDVTEGGDGYCDAAPESICGKPNTKFGELLDCEGRSPRRRPRLRRGLRRRRAERPVRPAAPTTSPPSRRPQRHSSPASTPTPRTSPPASSNTAPRPATAKTPNARRCRAPAKSRYSPPRPSPASPPAPNTTSGSPRPTAKARSKDPTSCSARRT